MKIDLQLEAQVQKTIDKVFLKVTPLWFTWLGWVIMIGGLDFLSEITNNVILKIVYVLSYWALWFYLQGLFFSLEFHGLPFIKTERTRRIVSLIISAILAFGLYFFLMSLVSEIKGKI